MHVASAWTEYLHLHSTFQGDILLHFTTLPVPGIFRIQQMFGGKSRSYLEFNSPPFPSHHACDFQVLALLQPHKLDKVLSCFLNPQSFSLSKIFVFGLSISQIGICPQKTRQQTVSPSLHNPPPQSKSWD